MAGSVGWVGLSASALMALAAVLATVAALLVLVVMGVMLALVVHLPLAQVSALVPAQQVRDMAEVTVVSVPVQELELVAYPVLGEERQDTVDQLEGAGQAAALAGRAAAVTAGLVQEVSGSPTRSTPLHGGPTSRLFRRRFD